MKAMFKTTMLAASCAVALGGLNTTVQAADWLMLQGAEGYHTSGRAKVWGFIQAQYQSDNSDPNGAGGYVPPKLIGPDLDSQEAFNVNRARIGVRGTGMPIDPNVNYFFLAEFGNNAITNPGNGFAKLTDASITLNHLKEYARIRAGQFKIPMAEEIYQGIALIDYVNFTAGTNQMLLERVPNRSFSGNVAPQPISSTTSLNAFNQSVDAARDVGVQVFNTFKVADDWEASYSFMAGNGNGINSSDNDNSKDYHLYFSTAKIFSGAGPKRQDWKTFAWYTTGKRHIDGNNDGSVEEYDRKRYGVGTRYLKLPFRVAVEWIKAEGVIFQGPDKPSFGLLPPSIGNPNHPANGLNNNAEANQWSVDIGYFIPKTKWELDFRYSDYTRMEDSIAEFDWKELTLGVQYHFNKKTRLTVNVTDRDVEATAFASGAGPNGNLDGIDKRYAVQLTHIF